MSRENPLCVLASSMLVLAVLLATIALVGCSTLEPNAVRVYAEHESHLLQHAPFTANPTAYGANTISIEAHWQKGPAFLDVAEGYNFHGSEMCDGMCGGRDNFTARVGLEFKVKP